MIQEQCCLQRESGIATAKSPRPFQPSTYNYRILQGHLWEVLYIAHIGICSIPYHLIVLFSASATSDPLDSALTATSFVRFSAAPVSGRSVVGEPRKSTLARSQTWISSEKVLHPPPNILCKQISSKQSFNRAVSVHNFVVGDSGQSTGSY